MDPPDLPRHGCNSDRGPAASGGPTVLVNDRNGGRLRLNASRHDDDDDVQSSTGTVFLSMLSLLVLWTASRTVWIHAQSGAFKSDSLLSPSSSSIKQVHRVQKKNTHSHFLSYLYDWCVDLNKNCSEYTQGTVDSENVEIRYSLRPMTSLWRHICKRL